MGINHASIVLWQIFPMWSHIILNFLVGIAFPIMSFFVVEGFRRTRNVKRYMLRLLVFGVIAQVPYMLAFGISTLNVVFSILLGLICINMHEKFYVEQGKKGKFVFLFILMLIVSLITESGPFGILMIFLFKIIKDEMTRRTIPLVVWGTMMAGSVLVMSGLMLLMNLLGGADKFTMAIQESSVGTIGEYAAMTMQFFSIPLGTFLIIPLLRSYNGELGRRAKYLFYTFYPLHFVVLIIIALALGLTTLSMPAPIWATFGF